MAESQPKSKKDSQSNSDSQSDSTMFEVKCDETFSQHQHSRLYELYQNSTLVDFTIRVKDHSLHCHKVVLAAVCPFFNTMLRSGLQEAQKNEVHLDELEWEVVQEVVRYCYVGEVRVEFGKMTELVAACEYLQMDRLKSNCEEHITRELSPRNCIGWYKVASLYGMEELAKAAKHMMCSHFPNVCEHEEFKDLSLAEVIDYIEDEAVEVLSGDVILDVCLEWVLHDVDSRKDHFKDLLQHAMLENCTAGFLNEVTEKYDNLFAPVEVQLQILKAFRSLALVCEEVHTESQALAKEKDLQKSFVLLGGCDSSNRYNKQCLYLSGEQKWETFSEMPSHVPSRYQNICLTNKGLIFTGGTRGNKSSNKCYLYTLYNKTWGPLPDMMTPRDRHASQFIGQHLFVFGGKSYGNLIKDVEALDIRHKTWKSVAKMIHPVDQPISTPIGRNIYMILSCTSTNEAMMREHGVSLQIYSTVKNKWHMGPQMPYSNGKNVDAAGGACAVSFHGNMYVIGGNGKVCNMYSPDTDTWTVLARADNVHMFGSAVVSDGNIMVFGGYASINENNTVCGASDLISVYDIEKNAWSTAAFQCPFSTCYPHVVQIPVEYLQ